MRVTVGMIAGGATTDELLRGFPYLEGEDIAGATRYAAWLASEREIDLAHTG